MKLRLHRALGTWIPHYADARTIISSALKDTAMRVFHMHGQNRPFSPAERARFFSRRWDAYREQFVAQGGSLSGTHPALVEAHNMALRFEVPKGQEVAVVGYPSERMLRGRLVKDKLDVVLIDKKNTEDVTLLQLDATPRKESQRDFGVQLRALFNYSVFLRELQGSPAITKTCKVLNLYHGYEREIVVTDADKLNYPRAISRIIQSIDQELYYPRASAEACKACLYRESCSWRQA